MTNRDGGESPDNSPVAGIGAIESNAKRRGGRRRRRRKKRGQAQSGDASANSTTAGNAPAQGDGSKTMSAREDAPGNGAGAPKQNSAEKAGSGRSGKRRRRRRNSKPANVSDNQTTPLPPEASSGPAEPRSRNQPEQQAGSARRRNRRRGKGRKGESGENHSVGAGQAGVAKSSPSEPRRYGRSHRRPKSETSSQQAANGLYAALDLGTNNCRLLVAIPQAPGRFRVVDAFSRIVRLGEGLGQSGRLRDDAMDRAVAALGECAEKIKSRAMFRQRLIATEACRRAENGSLFLERVREETGLDLEIVNRETEARLAVSGCGSLVDRDADAVVLFDIGGGSSELAILDMRQRMSRRLSDHIIAWTSLPLGVVTLAEKHGGGQDVSQAQFSAMIEEVQKHLREFSAGHSFGELTSSGKMHLLGTSGTVTTLAGVHLDLRRYDRRRVDGIWLADHEVSAMTDKLLAMDYQARMANPCIGRDRADLVLAGCAILEAIRLEWPSPRLRVADRGLREGLLMEMMGDARAWRSRNQRNRRNNRQRPPSGGKTGGSRYE
ncbi:MAG: Ppx/GppA phosphatase family protein [Pseudomonadota bacterium]